MPSDQRPRSRQPQAFARLAALTLTIVSGFFGLGAASAQVIADPKYQFAKPEEVADVEWTTQAKAGFILTTGNAQTSSFSFGLNAARKQAGNKFSFDAGIAYARSSVLTPRDANANMIIEPNEIARVDQTTANAWFTKLRYDRFFTNHNAAYVAALLAADRPAGKDFYGGGQVGYSRLLYKSARHEAVAELGYDLSHESYITPVDSAVTIHSMRAFLGETFKLSDVTSLYANFESLFNLNRESVLDADDPTQMTVAPFKDTRLVSKVGLTTSIWKNLLFTFGVTLKYDHNPAVRPAFTGFTYAPGFTPFADKLDTLSEAALVVNFI